MAFYSYRGDVDEYYSNPYSSTYDYDYGRPASVGVSSQYSSPYEFGKPEYQSSAYYRDDAFVTPSELNYPVFSYSEPKILQYEPTEYHPSYNYYEYSANPSEINYIQPKFLQYNPSPHDRGYFPSETEFIISYSNVEFNETEFEEYDPTPYGGGYDPLTTYGKPLPPSDITCYPRSVPESDGTSLENFSYSSIPSPYGKDDALPTKPPNGSKPTHPQTDTQTDVKNGGKVSGDGKEGEAVEPSDVIPSDDSPSYEHQIGYENGTRGDYCYENERQVPQVPYGSGLEAVDLCESIFGYWPCLAKKEPQQRNNCQVCGQETRMDPWKCAVDYLFGSPTVYDYENYHHHHHQPQYDCDQNSWFQ